MNSVFLIIFMLFIPLVSGVAEYVFKKGGLMLLLGVGTSFLCTIFLLFELDEPLVINWYWIKAIEFSILLDRISLLLIALVAFISLLVTLFSTKYMEQEAGKSRYFAFLGFFIFSMIGLLLSNHLLLFFLFWELVGVASYLLIGFWYQRERVPSSARTAFMVNRVADACLLAGILLLFGKDEVLLFSGEVSNWPFLASTLIVIGAFGKSAQFPFSAWLLKAMVGPTPVSALIHAATMVVAGVYLLIRVSPHFPSEVLNFLTIVGGITAFYAAICAILQHDIKQVLAFSTISQLGYMMLGVGVGSPDASIFHLITHAFFKAGLFLSSALIIDFMHNFKVNDVQDMRCMGGLKDKIPKIFYSFLVFGMALAGLPLFSGFLSKEGILLGIWNFAIENGTWAYLVASAVIFTVFLTSFYVGRIILLVFFGQSRFEEKTSHTVRHDKMNVPLFTLATFSIFVFFNFNPLGHSSWLISYLGFEASNLADSLIPFLSILMAIVGLLLSVLFFKPGAKCARAYAEVPNAKSGIQLFVTDGFFLGLFYNKFGIFVQKVAYGLSKIDTKVIDRSLHLGSYTLVVGSKVLSLFDRFLIDGSVNLIASLSSFIGKRLAGISSKKGQIQIFWLLVLLILFLVNIIVF